MELARYKACICEGSAENAIMDILLDHNLLIFSREEMVEEEIIRCREGKKFEEKYLRKGFMDKISVIRILDSRRENFKLMFISIISGATPLKNEPWGLANKMTSKALDAIGSIGGPRCCKRDSYIAIISAIDYVAENFNIQMEKSVIKCIHSDKNNQCIKERCPFYE